MTTPFTNSTLENFEGCEFHCEDNGWLVTDGELDKVDDEFDGIIMRLIIPTEYTACPCNPLYSMNDEMEGVVV